MSSSGSNDRFLTRSTFVRPLPARQVPAVLVSLHRYRWLTQYGDTGTARRQRYRDGDDVFLW